MTVAELTELIDRVVEEPGLYSRIQKGRELRLLIVQELRINARKGAPLTRRQMEIVRYLAHYHGEHGYAPNFSEIATRFGLRSQATVAEHVEVLERKGYLRREPAMRTRAIVLLPPAEALQ